MYNEIQNLLIRKIIQCILDTFKGKKFIHDFRKNSIHT